MIKCFLKFRFIFFPLLLGGCDPESKPERINSSPIAKFNISTDLPEIGIPITFDGSSSSDSEGYVAEYQWIFENEDSQMGVSIKHVFTKTGRQTVSLVVTDDGGLSDTTSQDLFLSLAILAEYPLSITSPSGLSLSYDKQSLWTVSDKPGGGVYNIDFEGRLIKSLDYSGADLEGVASATDGGSLWIVEEFLGTIIQIDTAGIVLRSVELSGVRDGGGLEGVTVNPNNGDILLLKEKDPGVFLWLNDQLEVLLYKRIAFANDFSGMDYDASQDILWIISDQDKILFKYKIGDGVIDEYPFRINKAEGLAVFPDKNILFIVSDDAKRLYRLALP